jgi:hypothetical protein
VSVCQPVDGATTPFHNSMTTQPKRNSATMTAAAMPINL